MNEPYHAGAYWLVRKESIEACARRAELFFRLLASCDPILAQWFKTGETLGEALMDRIPSDALGIQEYFEQRPPNLGFSLRMWNGTPDEAASTELHAGDPSVRVPNYCLVDLPEQERIAERLFQTASLTQILRAMIDAWDPEWGVVTSSQLQDLQIEKGEVGTFLGWITYFSHRRGTLPPLPTNIQVESVENKGSLVVLTPERFSTANPEHMERVHTVAPLLQQAGLLGPLKPWDS